jgi:guanylate cyclase soluble subunit beta
MYGLIHRYLKDHIIASAGDDVWAAIAAELQISPLELISQEIYDDALTFELVTVASRRLGWDVADCLARFGRFWVSRVSKDSYRAIIDFTGRDLATFIRNLDRMHHSVVTAMAKAKVPSFGLLEDEPDQLLVEYRSERSGLEPFVLGLLEGLLDHFGLDGSVRQLEAGDHPPQFRITLRARQASC